MNGDRQPVPRSTRHPLEERPLVGQRELVATRVAHERLEPDDTSLGELVEPVGAAGNEPAPEAEVDACPVARGLELEVERRSIDRRR